MPVMADLTVRAAAPDDYERLLVVFDEAEQFHREALPHVFRAPPDHFPDRALFESWVADVDADVIVADLSGELCGFVVVERMTSPETPIQGHRARAGVPLLAVRSDARRMGVGRRLMEAVSRWAQERDLSVVALTVWEFNQPALEFYESLGFRAVSRVMERDL
jgi:ribosomal protein S18 acetylase RimI-like enzyme